jgi:HK97 gp10 family phage protein
MAGGVTIKIDGLKDLDRALGELPKTTAKATLRRVAIKALQPFDAAWRANAERNRLTGALDGSGGVGTKLTRRQAQQAKKQDDKSFVEVYAGPNNPAAVPGEFGTVDQPPRPFMRPAWDATAGQVLQIVSDELGTEIDKSAKRLARKAARLAAKG